MLLLCLQEGDATALGPQAAAAQDRRQQRQRAQDHFGRISLSGALACSITHSLVVPLDVVKTRLQVDGSVRDVGHAVRSILRETKGPLRARVFLNGIGATGLGYYLQGGAKFGGYEVLKHNVFSWLRRSGGDDAVQAWRLPVMIGSAGVAEVFASVMLTPLEVVKLRLQTDPSAAARGLARTTVQILRSEGLGALYQGLKPITMRQLPYTVTKLVCYELCSTTLLAATQRLAAARPLAAAASAEFAQFLRPATVLASGLLAGAAAAVISQPADVLLTRLCASPCSAIAECAVEKSFREQLTLLVSLGLREAYAGLGPRLAMVSAMTSIQFLLYDWVRRKLDCDGAFAG